MSTQETNVPPVEIKYDSTLGVDEILFVFDSNENIVQVRMYKPYDKNCTCKPKFCLRDATGDEVEVPMPPAFTSNVSPSSTAIVPRTATDEETRANIKAAAAQIGMTTLFGTFAISGANSNDDNLTISESIGIPDGYTSKEDLGKFFDNLNAVSKQPEFDAPTRAAIEQDNQKKAEKKRRAAVNHPRGRGTATVSTNLKCSFCGSTDETLQQCGGAAKGCVGYYFCNDICAQACNDEKQHNLECPGYKDLSAVKI